MAHVHFIGIGGSGLSAIARLLLESGYVVSGSDRVNSTFTRELAVSGVRVFIGHDPHNIQGADLVIRSSAVMDDNPEVIAARANGIAVLKRSEYLGQWMVDRIGIAVAGTHGKTTTTAMMVWCLVCMGLDPSYIIGGLSRNLGVNAHAGKGTAFVIEADEYDRMFLGLNPSAILITNVEYDHPDCFPTYQDYFQAFVEFVGCLKNEGLLVACQDDEGAAQLFAQAPSGCKKVTYGLQPSAEYHTDQVVVGPTGEISATIVHVVNDISFPVVSLTLNIPGEHNLRNALGVLAVIDQLGLDVQAAAQAIASFVGTGRRFEIIGQADGVTIIDDYAHHPTEIRVTLAAARSRFPTGNIWAVWQPHTFSRTQSLLKEFAEAFSAADHVIVTEVFASREKPTGFSSARVVEQMTHRSVQFLAALPDVTSYLLKQMSPGDILIVLSAGDADQISANVLTGLKIKEQHHA